VSAGEPVTRTFLFTDLEGSTRLWEDEPDLMPKALARHDKIMQFAHAAVDAVTSR
jgi:class 3 adenylate cyclase